MLSYIYYLFGWDIEKNDNSFKNNKFKSLKESALNEKKKKKKLCSYCK